MRSQATPRNPTYQNVNYRRPQTTRAQPQRQQELVHEGINCDGCGMYPIPGVRYQCSVCRDFDFCEGCWQTKRHPHPFMRVFPSEQPQAQRVHPSRQKPVSPFTQERREEDTNIKTKTPEAKKKSFIPEKKISPVQQKTKSPIQEKPKEVKKGLRTKANTVIIKDETHNKIVDIIYCD